MPAELSAVNQSKSQDLEAYERLLTDAMKGDATLFVARMPWKPLGPSSSPYLEEPRRFTSMSRALGDRPRRICLLPIWEGGTIRRSSPRLSCPSQLTWAIPPHLATEFDAGGLRAWMCGFEIWIFLRNTNPVSANIAPTQT